MGGYNLPDNVFPGDPDAPWNQEESGYYEIQLSELVEFCGGPTKILEHNDPYLFMQEKQEELIDFYLVRFKGVWESSPQENQDYIDEI